MWWEKGGANVDGVMASVEGMTNEIKVVTYRGI